MKVSNKPPKGLIKNVTARTVAQVLKPKKFTNRFRPIRSDSIDVGADGELYQAGALRVAAATNGDLIATSLPTLSDIDKFTLSMWFRFTSPTIHAPSSGFGARIPLLEVEIAGSPGEVLSMSIGTGELYPTANDGVGGPEAKHFTVSYDTFNEQGDETVDYSEHHHLMLAYDYGHPVGQKLSSLYLDGAPVTGLNHKIERDDDQFLTPLSALVAATLIKFYPDYDEGQAVEICDLWMDFGTYLNPEVNHRKFRTVNGSPRSLGLIGNGPTGTQPSLFFHTDRDGSVADFLVNKGSAGGTWSFTGSTPSELASTSPSD